MMAPDGEVLSEFGPTATNITLRDGREIPDFNAQQFIALPSPRDGVWTVGRNYDDQLHSWSADGADHLFVVGRTADANWQADPAAPEPYPVGEEGPRKKWEPTGGMGRYVDQMIGRGTRLCSDLFGPGMDKQDFRVFDFCFNFDFFQENPDGIEAGNALPLGARLFQARVKLLSNVQELPNFDPKGQFTNTLVDLLHGEVSAMNRENFIVREHLAGVDRFRERSAWTRLSYADQRVLNRELSRLPSEGESEEIESRLFDLTALRLQLALAEGNVSAFEGHRVRVVEVAMLLEDKTAIPAVKAQLSYLGAVQTTEFWEGITLDGLDEIRLRLRGLMPFLDKRHRKVVYTDFQDEIEGVRDADLGTMPKMTGIEYEKKVMEYLKSHQDHLVIKRLRTNQPLTGVDLEGLETTLEEIGEADGESLLSSLLARSKAPSLAHFVRHLVGLDREAAQAAFSEFLNDRSLTARQMRFVELVIDQLTARGVMEASALYEAPFSNVHGGGPGVLFAEKPKVINEIFERLKAIEDGLEPKAG